MAVSATCQLGFLCPLPCALLLSSSWLNLLLTLCLWAMLQGLIQLPTEVTQHHFHQVLLVKTSQKVAQVQMGGNRHHLVVRGLAKSPGQGAGAQDQGSFVATLINNSSHQQRPKTQIVVKIFFCLNHSFMYSFTHLTNIKCLQWALVTLEIELEVRKNQFLILWNLWRVNEWVTEKW